jgi:prepilin-type processing-associated H-X9-DG protein
VNQHLADNSRKFGSRDFAGLTVTEVVLAGEKSTTERDYHMEGSGLASSEYGRVIEPYRHGITLGSNYLHFDGHVDTLLPNQAKVGIDPWALKMPDPTTQPSTN